MAESIPRNENERIIARINAVYGRLSDDPGRDDKRVLTFIRGALAPEAIAARHEEDTSVTHLHEVAKMRLKPYERTEATA